MRLRRGSEMNPVFIAAYLLNPVIYVENLHGIYEKKNYPKTV